MDKSIFYFANSASLRELKDKVAQRRQRPQRIKIRHYILAIT